MRLFLILAFAFSAPAWAEFSTVCSSIPGVNYCIYQDAASTNPDVVYHFHGRFGKAETWGETDYYTQLVRDEWKSKGVQTPKIISVSFGPVWLLAEKNNSAYSGLFEAMRDQVIPAIEQLHGAPAGRRILWGESMGGFNALQMSLKTNLFVKSAVLCAPVAYGITPFDPEEKIEQFIMNSAAYAYHGQAGLQKIVENVGSMVMMAKAVWETDANWQKSDPLVLASGADKALTPEMYINAGYYDTFALYEGNIELVKRLLQKGVKLEWHPEWGGHCQIDIPSLARFLVQ